MRKELVVLVVFSFIVSAFLAQSVLADRTTVITEEAEDITYHNATLLGEVTALDEDNIDVFFGWQKEDDWEETDKEEVTDTGKFNRTVTDLYPGITYEFKAIGDWDDNDTEGEKLNFTTYSYPEVQSKETAEITHESAILRANLTEIGAESEVSGYFNWTEEDGSWTSTEAIDVESEGLFEYEISGLKSSTSYDFVGIIDWDDGQDNTENVSFTTKPEVYVITLEAEDVKTNEATLRGELSGEEEEIDEGVNVSFFWKEEQGDDWGQTEKKELSSAGTFEEEVDEFESGTEYEFEAEVEFGDDSHSGEKSTFTTPPEFNLTDMEVDPEEVYVDEEFEVSATVENDGETDYEYEARLYVDGSYETSEYVEVSGGGSEEVLLNDSIGSSGDYELEVKVAGQTVEDDIEVYNKPSVSTSSPSEVGSDSAVLEGEVLEIGLEDEVTVFFRYGEKDDDEALWGETSKVEMEEEDSFEREVSLDEDKEYGYKAVLEWNDEEETGNVVSLMPDSCEYGNWENQTCGGWECDEEEIHQTKEVTDDSPTFCKEVKERCIEAEDYCGVPEAELNLEKEIVNVTAGETETNNVTVANTGTKDLEDVGLSLELEGPEEWYDLVPSGRTIDQKEEKSFEVSFSPGGGAPIGKYSVTYFLEDEIGTVEGSLWIHPDEEEESNIVERYHSLEEEKGELEERLETLEDKTEVEHIEEEMSMFRTLMSEAENAMNQDDYVTMSEKISEAERLRLDITDGIEDIEEELGLPWLWIGTGVIVILIAGIIIYMLLPPEEGYAKSKGYKSPSEKSFKDKLSEVKEKVKKKVFGEEEEGYSYQA